MVCALDYDYRHLFTRPFDRHSSISSHTPSTSRYPEPQTHLYEPRVFTHEAPWKQAARPEEHSFRSFVIQG